MTEFEETINVARDSAAQLVSDQTLRPNQAWQTPTGGTNSDFFGVNGSRIVVRTGPDGEVDRISVLDNPIGGTRALIAVQVRDDVYGDIKRGVTVEPPEEASYIRRRRESLPKAFTRHFDAALRTTREAQKPQ